MDVMHTPTLPSFAIALALLTATGCATAPTPVQARSGSIDQQPVVLIDFGSMGRLGFLNNHHRLLAVLLYILELAEM